MEPLPPQPLLITLGILLILGFLTAFAKASVIAINDNRLSELAEDNKRAKRLYQLLEKSPTSVMSSLDSFKNFILILFAGVAILGFTKPFYRFLASFGITSSPILLYAVELIIFTFVLSFLAIIFLEILPERLSVKHGEGVAIFFSGYTRFITALVHPLVSVPTLCANLLARIFGVSPHDISEDVTEEEIRMLVDMGLESGAIDDDEQEMIHNIFELDTKLVEDIMTHRKDVCVLWMEDSLEDWMGFIDETKHSRYPVCDEDIDNVIGIINTRDFYRFLIDGGQKSNIRSIIRKPYFVPDSMKADELFSRMQEKNTHIVVVMDEYGGFLGLATQEDLIEEIVGDLRSEYDDPEDLEIVNIDENTWKIKGSAEIDEVEKALDIELDEGDYNTFAGLILDAIGTLPDDGETAETEIGPMQIKITSVAEHRIEEAVVCLNRDYCKNEDNE